MTDGGMDFCFFFFSFDSVRWFEYCSGSVLGITWLFAYRRDYPASKVQ
jgi:hypothetical protein